VTQLQNQDPLSPTDNTEFIAQLAQFSSLEQMQQVNTALTNQQLMTATSQALSLVGRDVSYTTDDSADPVRGTVESVRFSGGIPKLMVGEVEVDPANVVQVW
jgi:flagellar basal-body rod modification protein FlgD